MNIQEMHQVFRTIAQQVGMQNVRGILPESIDIFLNDVIEQYVQSVIAKESINVANRVRTNRGYVSVGSSDKSISSINALRGLYKNIVLTKEYKPKKADGSYVRQYLSIPEVMLYTAFAVNYEDGGRRYDCRIIEADELENTLNDYCNGASFDYPLCSVYSDVKGKNYIDIYTGNTKKEIHDVVVKYFERPRKVCFGYADKPTIDCNLPDYTHNTIVRIAAKQYLESVNATSKPITS